MLCGQVYKTTRRVRKLLMGSSGFAPLDPGLLANGFGSRIAPFPILKLLRSSGSRKTNLGVHSCGTVTIARIVTSTLYSAAPEATVHFA